jgi:hypothetical protein
MSRIPPLLPHEALRRVLRVARLDGTSLLAIAGAFALVSAWDHDKPGTAGGLLVAGAGAIELHGAGLLRGGWARGMSWLIASQFCLLASILGFVAWQLTHVDTTLLASFMTDDVRDQLRPLHISEAEFLRTTYVLIYRLVAIITVAYQGGMAVYYARRRPGVIAALAESQAGP